MNVAVHAARQGSIACAVSVPFAAQPSPHVACLPAALNFAAVHLLRGPVSSSVLSRAPTRTVISRSMRVASFVVAHAPLAAFSALAHAAAKAFVACVSQDESTA